jgi:hypothetical protein
VRSFAAVAAVSSLAAALLAASPVAADVCWEAAVAASKAESWSQLRTELERGCPSDAVWAELQAEGVFRLLTQHWDKLPELDAIAKDAPDFLNRVLSLLDDSTPMNDAAAIHKSASEACPPGCGLLCARIAERVTR